MILTPSPITVVRRAWLCSSASASYMQSPVKPECWHLEPGGQPPMKQVSAQYLSPDWSGSTHCGFAVVPGGTSVGHDVPWHSGEHITPWRPWPCTACSSCSTHHREAAVRAAG